jgi:hypothetical protein
MRRTFVSRVTAWAFGLVMAGTGALVSAAVLTINPVKDNTIYRGVDRGTGWDCALNSCG